MSEFRHPDGSVSIGILEDMTPVENPVEKSVEKPTETPKKKTTKKK